MADIVVAIVDLMLRVLGHVFAGESWATWRTVLRAAFGQAETLNADERALMRQLTGREVLPRWPREPGSPICASTNRH